MDDVRCVRKIFTQRALLGSGCHKQHHNSIINNNNIIISRNEFQINLVPWKNSSDLSYRCRRRGYFFCSNTSPVCRAATDTAAAAAAATATTTVKADADDATSTRVDVVIDKILDLDVVELSIVTALINERMGVFLTAADRDALVKGHGMSGGGSATTNKKGDVSTKAEEDEKTTFDLKLEAYDAKAKIKVIKEIRTISNLGLKEAKELVESAPKIVQKDLKKEDAEQMKKKLEEVGATVEIV